MTSCRDQDKAVNGKTPLLLSDGDHRRPPNYDAQRPATPNPTQTPAPPSGDLGLRCWTSVFPAGFKSELREMLAIAPGLVLSAVCRTLMGPLATMFGGHLGKLELDAIGLANSVRYNTPHVGASITLLQWWGRAAQAMEGIWRAREKCKIM